MPFLHKNDFNNSIGCSNFKAHGKAPWPHSLRFGFIRIRLFSQKLNAAGYIYTDGVSLILVYVLS